MKFCIGHVNPIPPLYVGQLKIAYSKILLQCYLQVTAWGGVLVVVGFAVETITCDLIPALAKEIDIRGIFRYVNK